MIPKNAPAAIASSVNKKKVSAEYSADTFLDFAFEFLDCIDEEKFGGGAFSDQF